MSTMELSTCKTVIFGNLENTQTYLYVGLQYIFICGKHPHFDAGSPLNSI